MEADQHGWLEYSPRKRGCSHSIPHHPLQVIVFPAQAGVFPSECLYLRFPQCIPRASGGVPYKRIYGSVYSLYSPRKRGCSSLLCSGCGDDGVFPAQARVFPTWSMTKRSLSSIPRASGGGPSKYHFYHFHHSYSPRKRGCSHGVHRFCP